MRSSALLLMGVLLSVGAGCLDVAERGDLGPSAVDQGGAPALAPAPAPPVRVTHDFIDDAEEMTWETDQAAWYNVSMWSEPTSPARTCVGRGIRIALTSPGEPLVVENGDSITTSIGNTACGSAMYGKIIHAPAGEWRVLFEGFGTARGIVEVTPR